jgi:hypothetical protein
MLLRVAESGKRLHGPDVMVPEPVNMDVAVGFADHQDRVDADMINVGGF